MFIGIVTVDGQPEYTVSFVDRREKELRIAITNIGDTDAYNVSWLMYYPKPLPLFLEPNSNMMQGSILYLPVGSSYIVSTGPMFGFHLQGTVQVCVNDYCIFFGTKNIIGFNVVDPLFVEYENNFSSTPDHLYFGMTNINGTRKIQAFIQNLAADTIAQDVEWSIELSLFPAHLKPVKFTGTIDRILPGERVFVQTDPLFGFHLWADVFVYVNDYGPAHGYQHIIGPRVIFPYFMPKV
jgi:hypothetical protein